MRCLEQGTLFRKILVVLVRVSQSSQCRLHTQFSFSVFRTQFTNFGCNLGDGVASHSATVSRSAAASFLAWRSYY